MVTVLRGVLGWPGVQEGAITHVPSTQDLLAQVPVDRVIDTQAWRQRASSTKQACAANGLSLEPSTVTAVIVNGTLSRPCRGSGCILCRGAHWLAEHAALRANDTREGLSGSLTSADQHKRPKLGQVDR